MGAGRGRAGLAAAPGVRGLALRYDHPVDVCFYATLRQIVGAKRVAFELPANITVKDVLHAAEQRFPALSPLLWEADGGLSDYIKVFVDGREMRHLGGLETPVPADAQLDVFPPAAGG